jgi:dATP pyrophosphohydrolase
MNVLTGSISTYVFTMLRGRAQFLLLLRAPHLLHAGSWQAVHGMIDPGESAYTAAWRETVEETGLTPDKLFKTAFVESFYSEHTDAVHLVPAFAAFVPAMPDAPEVTLSEEHADSAWCALDDAMSRFVFPNQRTAIQLIAECTKQWPATAPGLSDISELAINSRVVATA